jgi:hypothetical protein
VLGTGGSEKTGTAIVTGCNAARQSLRRARSARGTAQTVTRHVPGGTAMRSVRRCRRPGRRARWRTLRVVAPTAARTRAAREAAVPRLTTLNVTTADPLAASTRMRSTARSALRARAESGAPATASRAASTARE